MAMTRTVSLVLLLLCTIVYTDCAKILSVCHFPSKSHHILASTLLKALAQRGHEVTMISPFPLKNPLKNYEDIELKEMLDYKEDKLGQHVINNQNLSTFEMMSTMRHHVNIINEMFLNHTALQNLMASGRRFDLVIQTWAWNDAFLGLAHHFEASSIALSTIGSNMMVNGITGNPAPHSYVPNIFLSYDEHMTFFQRLLNTVGNIGMEIFDALNNVPTQQHYLQKYFPKSPPLKQLLRNVSLVLLNSHYSIESPRPHVPSMIQIGGFHVEEPKELTADLKTFLDSAVDGVVFFSLGSNVKSSDLSADKLDAIIKTFAKLKPLKVLWKFENDDMPNLPSNVKIGKWLPQRDILAHRNLKVFVTHGGLLSTIEAVYHGIPMVGIPFFGDQDANVADGANKGYLVKVGLNDLTEKTLTNAINEVLNNSKYRQNIQQRSKVLKDQPIKPLDKAIFWVEYVLRHKGAHHLKTSALKLEWYQYYLLDVCAFLFGILLVTVSIVWFILCKLMQLIKKIFKKNKKSINPSKKKKSKVA